MMILFMPRITNLIVLGGIRLFTSLGIAPVTDRVLIRATGPMARIILPALSDGRAGTRVGVWGPRIFRAEDGGANDWCGAFCNRCVVAAKCYCWLLTMSANPLAGMELRLQGRLFLNVCRGGRRIFSARRFVPVFSMF